MARAEPRAGPRLYLIDGSGYVYRAFHALPRLSTSRGLPTNAALGFANMLAKLLREEQPRYTAVVFDAPGETFRDNLYAEYKQNRPTVPDELRPQIGYIRRIVDALRLPVIEVPGVEGTGGRTASVLGARLGPVERILERLDDIETSGLRGAKKIRETLAREAETARLSKALATIRCDVPITLDVEALRWEGPDPARLRPLFLELEFHSLLRELVPAGEVPEVERRAVRTPEEVAAT